METYKIVRMHFEGDTVTMQTGLTLEEAQEHCRDPETSSRTCTSEEACAYTENHGQWFDGYEEETKPLRRRPSITSALLAHHGKHFSRYGD